jgi:lipoic acid synthetase
MQGKRLPPWIKSNELWSEQTNSVRKLLKDLKLHTVCLEARCPNLGECYSSGTATFLILGNICTRNCHFCAVEHGIPEKLDPEEPARVAKAVSILGLKFAVLTSVTRDDLPDGGAEHYAQTIKAIKKEVPGCYVEVLVPDFQGEEKALIKVLESSPEVLAHNVETVPRLYSKVRPKANYERSLTVLKRAKSIAPQVVIKSGFMVGLGEKRHEIQALLQDLRENGCEIVTIGQYLRPRLDLLPVSKYYTPEEFSEFKEEARKLGFTQVESGPLVRSSYHAEKLFRELKLNH